MCNTLSIFVGVKRGNVSDMNFHSSKNILFCMMYYNSNLAVCCISQSIIKAETQIVGSMMFYVSVGEIVFICNLIRQANIPGRQ